MGAVFAKKMPPAPKKVICPRRRLGAKGCRVMLREKMLEFIVCPSCLGRLAPIGEEELVCRNPACRRSYEVLHGRIPNLVEEESKELEEAPWREKLDIAGLKPRDPEDRRLDPKRNRSRAKKKQAEDAAGQKESGE